MFQYIQVGSMARGVQWLLGIFKTFFGTLDFFEHFLTGWSTRVCE